MNNDLNSPPVGTEEFIDLAAPSGALFSGDANQYRPALWRSWEPKKGYVVFICLNPSTADAHTDDPTLRRCISYAKRWGFGAVVMLNLFDYRATDPNVMKAEQCPFSLVMHDIMLDICPKADVVVAAWGNHGTHQERARYITNMLVEEGHKLKCLKITKAGQPTHPLYQRADANLIAFNV